ncbi:MAG: 3-methyl-2-oxobutanoate hydroxymethyltransferase, partial [Terracidiphilus sp.]
ARAGAGALVLEGVPREAAAAITASLDIPTIGIGAGPDCDGQILVFHDLVNLTFAPAAKFVRRYGDAAALIRSAVEHYREDVEHRVFPSDAESYHLSAAARKSVQPDLNGSRLDDPRLEDVDAIVNQDALLDWEELSQA